MTSSQTDAQSTFLTSKDGTRLHAVVHGAGALDVLIVHGLAEHAERYAHVAKAWVELGFRVTVLELRGHGQSGGRRSHVMSWSEYVEDVKAAAATLRPGWRLFAHSMGGLVATDAVRSGVAPAKLALSNPLFGTALKVPPAKAFAGKILSKIWPTLALTNEIQSSGLSRDPEVARAYDADPDVYKKVTGRWFTEMMAAQVRISTYTPSIPVKFFIGGADPITSPPTARAWAQRVGAPIREWPEMRHELVNEIGKEEVIAEIGQWLRS